MKIPIKNKLPENELFRIKRMKEVIKTTHPHGHKEYLEIIYLEQGAGFHQIDINRYAVGPDSIYLVMPGQIHSWELTEIPKGFVAMVQKDFLLDHPLYQLLFQTFPLPFPNGFMVAENREIFRSIFTSIEVEYCNRKINFEAVIQTYLQLLFNLLKREVKSDQTKPFPSILQEFFAALETGFRTHREIRFYADMLNVTSKTLNSVCKKSLGLTAGDVIREKLAVESKKLLLYSNKSLTELAFELGFADASHFNKFFRRQTGVLPGTYRKGIS
jgi:AraC-like DNA-binding protein